MKEFKNETEQIKWGLSHNEKDVFHLLKLNPGNQVVTGQEFLEIFDTEEELESRVTELTGSESYYQTHKE